MDTFTLPSLVDPIEPQHAAEAFDALGLRAVRALKDPTLAMRVAATVPLNDGNRFLRVVLRTVPGHQEEVPDLLAFESEDEARLVLVGVLACYLTALRRQQRTARFIPSEADSRQRELARARVAA